MKRQLLYGYFSWSVCLSVCFNRKLSHDTPGTLTLSSGTGCIIAVPIRQQWVSKG